MRTNPFGDNKKTPKLSRYNEKRLQNSPTKSFWQVESKKLTNSVTEAFVFRIRRIFEQNQTAPEGRFPSQTGTVGPFQKDRPIVLAPIHDITKALTMIFPWT